MQTVPELTFEDIPIEDCENYGGSNNSIYDSNSDSDCGSSDYESSSQIDLINELEVILTYLSCRAYMFLYYSRISTIQANTIYILSLLFSGTIIFVPLLTNYEEWAHILVSIFGGLTGAIIVYGKHTKYDLVIQKYVGIHNAYANVENELAAVKSVNTYNVDKYRLLYEKIRVAEAKIVEMKKQYETPPSAYILFPLISTVDIFSHIHKIETRRKACSKRLASVRYEIRILVNDLESVKNDAKQKTRLRFLFDSKKKLKEERDAINYADINTNMENERKSNIICRGWWV